MKILPLLLLLPPAASAHAAGLRVNAIAPASYAISAGNGVELRLRFLGPRAFHLGPAKSSLPRDVPELMLVKKDADYAPPSTTDHESGAAHEFSTPELTVSIAPEGDDAVRVSVSGSHGPLVKRWLVAPKGRESRLSLQDGERIHGFGDKREAIDQRGHQLLLVNRDAYASETNNTYKNVPFYVSSAGYGLFLHNFHPANVDVGTVDPHSLRLDVAGGDLDFYFFAGDTYRDRLAQYLDLTGRPALLPRWFFGFHQSRASYEGREGYDVARTFREKKLPIDAIYYDGDNEIVNSKAGVDEFRRKYHVRLTVGQNPFVIGSGEQMDRMTRARHTLVDRANRPVVEEAPEIADDNTGRSDLTAYVDFFNPAAVRDFVSGVIAPSWRNGAVLGMSDFGELDHLKDPGNRHWPSVSLPASQLRNYFGLAYGIAMEREYVRITGKRPSGMIRPGTAGTQRLGWTTTGDSEPAYRNFRFHVAGLLNLSLTGFSNTGYDIGGWETKGPDTLYGRWFAAGTFNPFMWAHGQKEHEPWVHGTEVEKAAHYWLRLRYKLLPYLYSLSEEANRTGVPILRPWALAAEDDPRAGAMADEFFLGDGLLVAPLFNDEGTRKVELPRGTWYDFLDERAPPVEGGGSLSVGPLPLDRLPVYARAGTVIPLGPAMQYSDEKAVDPLTVHYYLHPSGTHTDAYSLYEDDGESYAYRSGRYQRTELRFDQSEAGLRFQAKVESGDGRFRAQEQRGYLLHVRGATATFRTALVNGKPVPKADSAHRPKTHASWGQDGATLWLFVPAYAGRELSVELQ